jgi:hypothetical protein
MCPARFKLKLRDLKDAPCRSRRQSPMGMLAEIPLESAGTKANQTFAAWISLADAIRGLRLP